MTLIIALILQLLSCLALANSSGGNNPHELPGELPFDAEGQNSFQIEVTPPNPGQSGPKPMTPGQQQLFGHMNAIEDAIKNLRIEIDPNSIQLDQETLAYFQSDEFKASIGKTLEEIQAREQAAHQETQANSDQSSALEQSILESSMASESFREDNSALSEVGPAALEDHLPPEREVHGLSSLSDDLVQLEYGEKQDINVENIAAKTTAFDSNALDEDIHEPLHLGDLPFIPGACSTLMLSTSPESLQGQEIRRLSAQADQLEASSDAFQVAAGVASKIHLLQSDVSYSAGEISSGNESLALAREIIDVGLGFVPIVSNVLDAVTAVTGYNVITGRMVSGTERILIATGIFMPKIVSEIVYGSGKTIGKALPKVLGEIESFSKLEGKAGQVGSELAVAARSELQAIESALRNTELSGFNLSRLHPGNKIDDVIVETLLSNKNVTSQFVLTSDEALEAGIKWVGPNHSKIAPGVYRSEDKLRQFRIDSPSLDGAHRPYVPHVHFESFTPQEMNTFKTNNHVKIE